MATLTDYLEGVADEQRRERIDAHLELCPDCCAALAQFELIISAAGHLRHDDLGRLDDSTRRRLVEIFVASGDGASGRAV